MTEFLKQLEKEYEELVAKGKRPTVLNAGMELFTKIIGYTNAKLNMVEDIDAVKVPEGSLELEWNGEADGSYSLC